MSDLDGKAAKAASKLPPQAQVPAGEEWDSRDHIKTLVLMLATVFGVYLCYRITLPFLPVLVWAVTLAIMVTPLQRWLELKLKKPSLAALISIFLISLTIILPSLFVGQQLVTQAVKGSQLIETKLTTGEWQRVLDTQPQLKLIVSKVEQHVDIPNTIKNFNAKLSKAAGAIVKGSILQLLGFVLVFYLMFFFLRDRNDALKSIVSMSPLTKTEMAKLFKRVGDTIHATVYGTFVIAAVQGALGGLMFWWLDLPAPFLWGLVMSFLAIVPVLGTFIVWMPAALFLGLQGNWGSALILVLWGMLVIGTIDNLLRPIFVGNRLKLHTVLIFISVIGGLLLFGAAGLILGPVTLAVTITLLEIWLKRNAEEA